MTSNPNLKKQNRLRSIEERKIEIIMEIAHINNQYSEKVSRLNSGASIRSDVTAYTPHIDNIWFFNRQKSPVVLLSQ